MSVLSQVVGLPGMRAAKTVLSRMVTRGGWIPSILPQGRLISGACSRDPSNTPDIARLQAGLVMGKITTVQNSLGTATYYAPSIYGVSGAILAAGGTSLTSLAAAVVTEILRRAGATGTIKITGPATANGLVVTEVLTISGSTSTTLTVSAAVNNYVAGSFLQPNDGSEDLLTFLPNGAPMMATDFDGNSQDVPFAEIPIDCVVDSAQLLPVWPTDTSLQEYLVSRLNRAGGGKFQFNHTY